MQRIIYKIILFSIAVMLLNCRNKATENQIETVPDNRIFVSKAQFERSNMTLGVLEEQAFPEIVKTIGMIDVPPQNRAVVNATMGGYIKTTPLLIGDKVHQGQVLVTLENLEFVRLQKEYMEVSGQLSYLKSEFERQQTMIDEKITSQKKFLQAESAYKTAKASYNGLRKQLQMLNISPEKVETGAIQSVVTIYAPISGSISKVNVTRGAYVSPATAIIEIIDNSHIHLELSVFEKDIMKIKKGQKINFKISESSNEIYKAEVHLIGTAIEANRTIKIHGHIENEDEVNFLTGMFVEAEIITASNLEKALPETAIVTVDNNHIALKLVEDTNEGYYFERVFVEVGNTHNGNMALQASRNLKTTDKILTTGTFNLIADE